jgi:hypothetical protein
MDTIASLKGSVTLKNLTIYINLIYPPVDLETHDASYLVCFLPNSIQSLTLIDWNKEEDFPYPLLKDGLQVLAATRPTFSCLRKIQSDLEDHKFDMDTKQTFLLLGVNFGYERFKFETGK